MSSAKNNNPGYVGFANLPNQVHRKFARKGFDFTIAVVGESGLGKSTLISSLFLIDLFEDEERHIPTAEEKMHKTVEIEPYTVEIDERGVKVRLTVVDTPGYGDSLNGRDQFSAITDFVDEKFEAYFQDEIGLNRRHINDHRVHACLYFISPLGYGLKPLDIEFMRNLQGKVNIIPIIAKADTLTRHEVERLKRRIMEQLETYKIKFYNLPEAEDDEEEGFVEQLNTLRSAMPFAVVGSTQTFEVKGRKIRGRLYPWGVVELENQQHSDFVALRNMLISHMQDLQEVTHDVHYENFRAQKLATEPDAIYGADPLQKQRDTILAEKDKELQQLKEMMAKMQAQINSQAYQGSASSSDKSKKQHII